MLQKPILHLPLHFDFNRLDSIIPLGAPGDIRAFYSTEANPLEEQTVLDFYNPEIERHELEGFNPDNIALGACFALPGLPTQVLCIGQELNHDKKAKRSIPKSLDRNQAWIIPSKRVTQAWRTANDQLVALNFESEIFTNNRETCVPLKNLYWFKQSDGFSSGELKQYKVVGLPFLKKWTEKAHWKKLYQAQALFCDTSGVVLGPSKLSQLALCLEESLKQTNSENYDNEAVKQHLRESMTLVETRLSHHFIPVQTQKEEDEFQAKLQKTGWFKHLQMHHGEWADVSSFMKTMVELKALRRFESKSKGSEERKTIADLRSRNANFIVRLNSTEKNTKKAHVVSAQTAFILNDTEQFGFETELYKNTLFVDLYFDNKEEARNFVQHTAEVQGDNVDETVSRVEILHIKRLDPDYAYLVFNEEFNEGMRALTALTGQDFSRYMGFMAFAAT